MRHLNGFIGAGQAVLLTLGLAVAGCSGDDGAPTTTASFPPLHYDYLTPIRLNVASVVVDNQAAPADDELVSRSPVSPEAAMERMARDRLVAAGPSGTATFTVTEASITRGENGLTERLSAHLDISSADGARAAFAEAHVTRSATGDGGSGPAALYELTRAAMRDMNVEFEYQVRHSLHDWIVSGDTVEAPVEQTPLGGGAAGSPMPLAPAMPAAGLPPATGATVPPGTGAELPPATGEGAPMSLVPPPSAMPPSSQAPEPAPVLSPPPGFLAPPPGAAFVPPSSQAVPPATGGY